PLEASLTASNARSGGSTSRLGGLIAGCGGDSLAPVSNSRHWLSAFRSGLLVSRQHIRLPCLVCLCRPWFMPDVHPELESGMCSPHRAPKRLQDSSLLRWGLRYSTFSSPTSHCQSDFLPPHVSVW